MDRLTTRTIKKKLAKPEQAHYEALSIAKYLFSLEDPHKEYFKSTKKISTGAGFSTILLGNWRLNQILYLCQVFYYVKHGKFLFKDDLYAFDNGFIVYDAYRNFWALCDKAWFLNKVESVQDKEVRKFIKMVFNYFKKHTQRGLQEWYTNDPAWIEAWLEGKKEPKLEFNHDALAYYENYFDSHLYRIEHPK